VCIHAMQDKLIMFMEEIHVGPHSNQMAEMVRSISQLILCMAAVGGG
jgi:hypothetical protein